MVKQLQYSQYLDRIYAGWLGKSLGGIVGAPFECHKIFSEINQNDLWPKTLYPNDDLDIQVVWLEALQHYGVAPSAYQLARFWQEHCFYVWCEYGVFVDNMEHGIYPPLSGVWNNDFFARSEGCPIRSEIWGFIAPNNPHLAMEYAGNDGCLDHTSSSVELEQFLAVAASLAFFESDTATLLEKTCEAVPESNVGRKLFLGVRNMCTGIESTHEIWLRLVRQYGSGDSTNALINNAFAFLALLRGGDDFKEVMRLCVQFGWDADCSCATAGALWGATHGSKALPQDWVDKMGKTLICACDVPHKNALLTDFAKETAAIGVEAAALRNPQVELLNAPAVKIRPLPAPTISIQALYPEGPSLGTRQATKVTLQFRNPLGKRYTGTLSIQPPPDVVVLPFKERIAIPANGMVELTVEVKLAEQAAVIHDRNILTAKLVSDADQTVIEHRFGLQGVEQWLVYGPYWDMWDKEVFDVCPYQNETITCNPGNVPNVACDAVNCHVRFRNHYLDEESLQSCEIPAEIPFVVEKGGRHFQREDLYAFDGASCCYLVREFKADSPVQNVQVRFYADCPHKCWIDGKLLVTVDHHSKMESNYGATPKVNLTGDWQRIVIKLASHLDSFQFQLAFYNQVETTTRAISPYVPLTTKILHNPPKTK